MRRLLKRLRARRILARFDKEMFWLTWGGTPKPGTKWRRLRAALRWEKAGRDKQ